MVLNILNISIKIEIRNSKNNSTYYNESELSSLKDKYVYTSSINPLLIK